MKRERGCAPGGTGAEPPDFVVASVPSVDSLRSSRATPGARAVRAHGGRLAPLGRGFTLIEVLVAVAILGLGLTAILAAQAGTFASVGHAKHLSQASGLLRCKMSEVEEDLRVNGFDIQDVESSGPCCDGTDDMLMTCTWRVERPTFPEPRYGELNLDTKLDLGPGSGSASGSKAGLAEALGSLSPGKSELPQTGNVSDVAGALAESGGNIADGATQMMMGIVYPEVQQIFQSGTRRITVTISWLEGKVPFQSDLVQWVTNARAAGVTSEIPTEDVDDPSMQSTGAGSGNGNGNGKSSGAGNGQMGDPGGNPFAPRPPRQGQ